jgi:photosystem II stability/assembly factor-like uncharacterized protein
MRQLLSTTFLVFINLFLSAQSGWRAVGPNFNASRIDDIFFINDTVGWSAGSILGSGMIHMTRNGGTTWQLQATMSDRYLRSIEFINARTGFCGSLDSSFYKTTDGGNTWVDIRHTLPQRIPGICGLSAPDSNTIYGVGVWFSPAFFIKSTDGGTTWTWTDMSAHARGLVEVYFINKDTGFVSGMSPVPEREGVILYTENGGQSWQKVYRSFTRNEFVWKIQTPDRKNFFASIETAPGSFARIARSSDGKNWATTVIKPAYDHIQAVGFINRWVGWAGGHKALHKTTDGGQTWTSDTTIGSSFNRFFRVNSKVAYLSGKQVYKYNGETDPGLASTPDFDEIHSLKVFPNPVSRLLRIETVFANPTMAHVEVTNAAGVLIATLHHGFMQADSKTFELDMQSLAAGLYFVILHTNEGVIHRKVIKQ